MSTTQGRRVASNFPFDVARGYALGITPVHKFGYNAAFTSVEPINSLGAQNWLTAATAVRIKAGGNAADAAAGAGAQSITVEGLDENWNEVSADITCNANGTLASSATTQTFIRVSRAYVKDVGTYSAGNTGAITVENGAGGTDLIQIAAGKGQSQTTAYTVPAGKTAYLMSISAHVDSNQAVDLEMYQRRNADDATTPFSPKRLVTAIPQSANTSTFEFFSPIVFPEKTDLWFEGTAGTSAAAAVDYELWLV